MPDDVEAIGGMRAKDIHNIEKHLLDKIAALERAVLPNGRPGLEDRLRAEITASFDRCIKHSEERDEHKMKSVQQMFLNTDALYDMRFKTVRDSITDLGEKVEKQGEKVDAALESTNVKVDAATNKMSWAAGALAVISAAQPFILHYLK